MANNSKDSTFQADPYVLNKVVMSGVIVSVRGDADNGTLLLACPLITTVRQNGKLENLVRTNFPSLSFNKNTKTKNIVKDFKRGDHVTVKGYVRTYLRQDSSGETREVLNVYIDEIEQDLSKMMSEFCREGRIYPESKNEVYLSGTLAGITKLADSILSVRLDLSEGDRRNVLNAIYYRVPSGLAADLAIGDKVNILGMIQTIDTKKQQTVRNYQSLVILEMAK